MIRRNFQFNTAFNIHTVYICKIKKDYWNDLQFASGMNSGRPSWASTCTNIYAYIPKFPAYYANTKIYNLQRSIN
jgi:hypothetical protein